MEIPVEKLRMSECISPQKKINIDLAYTQPLVLMKPQNYKRKFTFFIDLKSIQNKLDNNPETIKEENLDNFSSLKLKKDESLKSNQNIDDSNLNKGNQSIIINGDDINSSQTRIESQQQQKQTQYQNFSIEIAESESECHQVSIQIIQHINKYLKKKQQPFIFKEIAIYYDLVPAKKNGNPKKFHSSFQFKDSVWGVERLQIQYNSEAILKQQVPKRQVKIRKDSSQNFQTSSDNLNSTDGSLLLSSYTSLNSPLPKQAQSNNNLNKQSNQKTPSHYSSTTLFSDKKTFSEEQNYNNNNNEDSFISNFQVNRVQKQVDQNQQQLSQENLAKLNQKKKKKPFFSFFYLCCNNY
ncbi:hypothetical protein PPERSA_09244 [Pseudocohnilembus persalinus]|uniref:Uncharacterized protein n=1 Tax=Pseudocohnilembus persalinus TaxID=266149 RepID=A0A0V0QMP3_PSEPJ|nr:hypothetical protein PPERSA_09244 [Pseudocohnilembus persalinus]|eukprot:KRX03232.1 hypothetical protein PPERSA_09244 [Pseudocohnilembus persalinus]